MGNAFGIGSAGPPSSTPFTRCPLIYVPLSVPHTSCTAAAALQWPGVTPADTPPSHATRPCSTALM